jgi:mRNA interferase MazF
VIIPKSFLAELGLAAGDTVDMRLEDGLWAVAPMTTGSQAAPYRISLRFRRKNGLILLDQLRELDKQRLVRRLGVVDTGTLNVTLTALRETFEE